MNSFQPDTYGPVFAPLVADAPLNVLGPGQPVDRLRSHLEAIDVGRAFAPHAIADYDMASACLAGLWLRYDFLDASHTISQSIETATGSFWHGIMHRREPDYDNAKYWFRRVKSHPVFAPLAADAQQLASQFNAQDQAAYLLDGSAWDPFRFVDLVAAAERGAAQHAELCQHIQRREWELLFDHCYHAAIGAAG